MEGFKVSEFKKKFISAPEFSYMPQLSCQKQRSIRQSIDNVNMNMNMYAMYLAYIPSPLPIPKMFFKHTAQHIIHMTRTVCWVVK